MPYGGHSRKEAGYGPTPAEYSLFLVKIAGRRKSAWGQKEEK
jgi:hypothetical protein